MSTSLEQQSRDNGQADRYWHSHEQAGFYDQGFFVAKHRQTNAFYAFRFRAITAPGRLSSEQRHCRDCQAALAERDDSQPGVALAADVFDLAGPRGRGERKARDQ